MTPVDRVEKCFAGVTLPLDSLDIEVLKLSMEEAIAEEREASNKDGPLVEAGVNAKIKNGEVVSEEPRFISMRQALEEMSEAADVEANEADRARKALKQAVLDEREACAKTAEQYYNWNPCPTIHDAIAKAIRKRSKSEAEG